MSVSGQTQTLNVSGHLTGGHLFEIVIVLAVLLVVVGGGALIALTVARVGGRSAGRAYARERERLRRERRGP